jgi:hypothetical protein
MSVCSKSEMLVEPDPVISSLEIESIPPLPLFALYAADHEKHEYNFFQGSKIIFFVVVVLS